MAPKLDDDDFCTTTEFDFADPGTQKQFYQDSCDVVDREGSTAEVRFDAVRDLGERLQEKCRTSKKSLRNIYNLVVASVLHDYGISKSQEPVLRSMLMVYWKRGPELRAALEPRPPVDKRHKARAEWEKICDRQERTAPPATPICDDMSGYERDPVCYSFSREAGPG